MRVTIRQRVEVEALGDRARVTRILAVGDQVYVDVEQTLDATEPTIMAEINRALEEREKREERRDAQQ